MNELISYAKSFIGVPYIYGGEHPAKGFDCSGLVQEILRSVGLDPKFDQSAQMLNDYFMIEGKKLWEPQAGALIFYGKSEESISHVAFCISNTQLIEAGGGDSSCKDIPSAVAKGAFVRIRPIDHRKDRVNILLPAYHDWMTQMSLLETKIG